MTFRIDTSTPKSLLRDMIRKTELVRNSSKYLETGFHDFWADTITRQSYNFFCHSRFLLIICRQIAVGYLMADFTSIFLLHKGIGMDIGNGAGLKNIKVNTRGVENRICIRIFNSY